MNAKVGIVLVSYNAPTAVRVTLASLRATRNEVPVAMVLVDNASGEEERVLIRDAMERHIEEADCPWEHLQQNENLGFSGGNNVGIRRLLEDPTITHICLLNSDVIVPNGWLDGLLASGRDIVSPVTNKAESEQCVPIDYSIAIERALDESSEALCPGVLDQVDEFARRRGRTFAGNVVDCDATFFCVLLSRSAIESIGLLDETFFPGGFEDDDYCIRARQQGYGVYLARDVFVHHWGSASFGKLDFEYFSSNADRNRSYLEEKHGIEWRRRYERPFVSLAQDMAPVAAEGAGIKSRRGLVELAGRSLGTLLADLQREFVGLYSTLERIDAIKDQSTPDFVTAAETTKGLAKRWRDLLRQARDATEAEPLSEGWSTRMHEFAGDVHAMVECTFAIHALVTRHESGSARRRGSLLGRLWSLVRHGVPFVLKLRGVVFLGGYPYAARDNDGYFQRIRVIDGMFSDRWRIYFDANPLPGQDSWYDIPAHQTLVLRGSGSGWKQLGVLTLVWLLAMRCRFIYFHSVLRMQEYGLGRLMRLPFTRRVLDVHGVVPEEFRMHSDFFSARLHDRQEQLAARRASCMIVVTESMRRYVCQKYGNQLRADVVVLPIFPGLELSAESRPYSEGRPVVVYAGGLHKWQQVPLMVDAIERTVEHCDHRFYCTDPDAVRAMLSSAVAQDDRVVVASKSHEELLVCYRECHFGFLLRADSVVNHVACPTKVVEYLAMGIVPILDSEEVGDFVGLGMKYVRITDFVAGQIPDESERDRMVAANYEVYGRLRAQRESGVAALRQFIGRGARVDGFLTRLLWKVAKLLPPDTVRGNVARSMYRTLRRQPKVPPVLAEPVVDAGLPDVEPCDVLVQVDNFNAGGLENVVLDLNVAFQEAGLRVGMLVLVEAGDAVERARQQGVHVVVTPYSDAAYRHCLAAASPKVVISHYSMSGAAMCSEAGIPLVQVIHNTYMWLDDSQREKLAQSVPHTTLFVAVSEYVRNYSIRRLALPSEKCRVIANGIEVARYRPSDQDVDAGSDRIRLRQGLGIPDDAFVFLSVGSVNHQKNHLSLVKAFAHCAKDCPKAYLVVIGPFHEAELLRKCRAHIEQHALDRRVLFTGGVSDAHRYYAMADCYAHSAFFEGGQLSMLEALAANLPIVTTEIGFAMHFKQRRGVRVVPAHFDIAEYEGHITQMKASPDSERALAEALRKTYLDPVRPNLSAIAVSSFDRSNSYDTYVELVRGFVAGSSMDSPTGEKPGWVGAIASEA